MKKLLMLFLGLGVVAVNACTETLGIEIFDCNQALLRALSDTHRIDVEQEQRAEEMVFAPV